MKTIKDFKSDIKKLNKDYDIIFTGDKSDGLEFLIQKEW